MTRRWFKFALGLMPLIAEFSALPALQAQSIRLSSLNNGDYQVCSQPPPKDWQQGAGVCLVFSKQNDRIKGYYGYPNSDAFVCLRGVTHGTQLIGQGYLLSWEGSRWDTSLKEPFFWDDEKQLWLEQGQRIQSHQKNQFAIERILFQKATLNLQTFYLYQKLQMTSPKQLCDWSFKN